LILFPEDPILNKLKMSKNFLITNIIQAHLILQKQQFKNAENVLVIHDKVLDQKYFLNYQRCILKKKMQKKWLSAF